MGKREQELFYYFEGKLFWKSPTSNRVRVGQEAGSLTTNGYKTIRYDCKTRMLHRVVWDYHNFEGCEGMLIDHKDGNRLNNSIENLRICSRSENAANSKAHSDRKTRLKGVHKHPDERYRAQISKDGKRFHLGLFKTEEEAHKAYKTAAENFWGGFHYGGENR